MMLRFGRERVSGGRRRTPGGIGRLGVIACLPVLLAIPLGAGETVRVATYNAENYLVMDRRVDEQERWRPEYPKPESEKAAFRGVVRAVAPDVLALQEMGGPAFVRELQRDLQREGLDYPHCYVLEAEDEVRRVAVLSKLPFRGVTPHTDADFPYFGGRERIRRGLLEIEFETSGEAWTLFTLHLKSKWTEREDDPEAERRRTGEATAARDRILERRDPEDPFLIAGDFNDTRDTPALRRFLRRGDVTIAEPLEAADSRGHRWTQYWERQDLYSRIDFILVSPGMRARLVPGAFGVYDGPGYGAASDHRLVWADFCFGGGPAGVASGKDGQ